MIEWKIPTARHPILIGNKIRIAKTTIILSKESFKMISAKYSRSSRIIIGAGTETLYLKQDKDGYRVTKQKNSYSIAPNLTVIEELIEKHDLKRGIYEIESIGDGVFECSFIEE